MVSSSDGGSKVRLDVDGTSGSGCFDEDEPFNFLDSLVHLDVDGTSGSGCFVGDGFSETFDFLDSFLDFLAFLDFFLSPMSLTVVLVGLA